MQRYGHRHAKREDHTDTGGRYLPAKKKGLKRTIPVDTLILDFQPPELGGNKCCILARDNLRAQNTHDFYLIIFTFQRYYSRVRDILLKI